MGGEGLKLLKKKRHMVFERSLKSFAISSTLTVHCTNSKFEFYLFVCSYLDRQEIGLRHYSLRFRLRKSRFKISKYDLANSEKGVSFSRK